MEAVTRVTQNTPAAVAWACAGAAVLERVMLEGAGVARAVRATVQELRNLQEQQGKGPPSMLHHVLHHVLLLERGCVAVPAGDRAPELRQAVLL